MIGTVQHSVKGRFEGVPGHSCFSAMHGFCGAQGEAQHLLAVVRVAAARKAAQVTAQVFEPAFAQVGRAQSVSPVHRKVEEGQNLLESPPVTWAFG